MSSDIYFAAPFFSLAERTINGVIVSELEAAGLSVFAPARDGIRMRDLMQSGQQHAGVVRDVWHCDREAIDRARCVIAVLDGRTVDEGVCVEIGIAAAIGKPILGFWSDERAQFAWGLNPMVAAPLLGCFDNVASLVIRARDLLSSDANSGSRRAEN